MAVSQFRTTNRTLAQGVPQDVAIVDGSGNQITTFGGAGGTSSVDESAFVAGAGQGTPMMGLYETAPTSLTNGQVGLVGLTATRQLKVSGSLSVAPTTAGTATLTAVAESASSVNVLAANANRLGAVLFNDSASACYIKFGTTASASSKTDRLLSRQSYPVPFAYTGRIDAIWDTAPGTLGAVMTITELTA